MDADGIHSVAWSILDDQVTINDTRTLDAIYIVAKDAAVRDGILHRRQLAIDHESANPVDLDALSAAELTAIY